MQKPARLQRRDQRDEPDDHADGDAAGRPRQQHHDQNREQIHIPNPG